MLKNGALLRLFRPCWGVHLLQRPSLTVAVLGDVLQERGDALLFYSLHFDATKDPTSFHGSCPTTKGEKWSATKWLHVYPLGG